MEENPLPPGQTVPPSATMDSLDGAGTQAPVSSFAAAQKDYPVNETLEVHKEGARSQGATYTPTLRSVPFSRRKATLVSLFITLIVLVLTGASAIFLINRDVLEDQSQLKVPQQNVSVGEAGAALPELEGSGDALLVNGNIITRGELQVVSGDFTSSLRTDTLTGDQIFTLPNASGTVCLDANNCNFATQDQIATETAEINQQAAELAAQAADIAALQAQLAQIVIPPAGVTSLNGFAGGVTIQGTPNQIIVNAAGGTITLATPQDLATLSSPTFAGLTLNGGLSLTGSVTLPLDCTGFTNDGKLTTNAAGQIICGNDVGGGGGGAPADAEYLVVSLNPGLNDERALQAGANIAFTDGGANGNFTVATVQDPTFTTSVTTPLLTSTGALAITPGGPLTVGVTSQATLLQGSTTTVTSSAGNNIVLNSGNTIELQDNTNITGNLNVTGTGNIDGVTSIGNNASPVIIAPLSVGHDLNGINCEVFGCYGVFSSLTATNVTGANPGVSGFSSGIEVASGNLDGAAGFFVANPSGAGTVTNNYGVYVSNMTKGVNDYGIYVQGAETYGLWIDSGATRLDGTLEVQTLGGNDTDTVLCHNSANQIATCNSTFATTTDLDGYVQLQGVTPGTAQTGHINVTGTIIAGSFSGNGANLTNLNASALATGTVANARLVNGGALSVTAGAGLSGGGSVALGGSTSLDVLYGSAAGTAVQGNTAITCPSGTGNLTGGGDVITLGNGGTCSNLNTVANPTFATSVTTPSLILTGVGSNGTLEVASLGQATTYTLPDPGQATADICLSTGNCAGMGGGVTTSGGTTNTIALFTGSQSIGDSIITQSGSVIDIAGSLTLDTQLAVAEGGTGATSFAANGVLYGNGTSAVQATVAPTAGQVLIGNGAGVPTFTTFSGDITVSGTGVTTLQPNSVALGTDTTGNYVANLGALTGLSTTGNTGEGSTPTLSVLYGSTANTAVQGNTTLTCASGTGNLTGGGNSVTLGGGGACSDLTIVDDPTFATSVTTPAVILTGLGSNGTLEVASLGQATTYTLPDPGQATADICLSTGNCAGAGGGVTTGGGTTDRIAKFTSGNNIEDSSISDDGSLVTVNGNVNLEVQGTNVTIGAGGTRTGSIVLHNSTNTNTVSLESGVTGTSYTLTLPTAVGVANQCLKAQDGTGALFWDDCLGGGGGSGITSVNGQTGPSITINNASGAGNAITIDDASTAQKGIAQFNATNFTAAGGVINTIQDIHTGATPTFAGLTLNGTLNMGANDIQGTNFSVDGATGNVTSGLINGQTISSSANFTGTVDVATSITTPLLQSTGAINITPGGALTVGATGQTLTLQGDASTTLTATGGGFTTTVGFDGAPTGDVTYNFDRSTAAGTYEICSSAGNCAGLGQVVDSLNSLTGDLTLAGTAGQIDVSNGADTITLSLDSAVTLQGNDFNGPSQLVQLNASGQLPAISGALLTDLNGSAITTGTVANARLVNGGALTVTAGTGLSGGGSVALGGSTTLNVTYGNTANTAVEGNTSLTCPSGTGNLTGGGTAITLGTGGTCADIDTVQNPTFTTSVTTPQLILTGAGSNGTLEVASLGQATTYNLIDPGQTSVDICLSTGNCAGAGGGITGSGTNNTVAKFTGSGTIGDSSITDDGATVGIGANTNITGTLGASGNINTTGGAIQTNSTTRIDNSGNLTNINNAAIGGTLTVDGLADFNGGLTIEAGDTFTFNGDAFTDLTGTGLQISAGSLQTTLGTSVDLTSEVTGVLPIASGGTGASTAQGAINNISGLTTNGDLLYHNGTNTVRLARGTNGQCLTSNASTILWSGCGSGVTAVGAFAASSQTDGASISGSTITFGPADTNGPGMVTTGTQTFAGAKTFNGAVTMAAAGTGLNVTNNATVGGNLTVQGTGTSSFAGNLGVGTTNPTSRLHVQGEAAQSGTGTISSATGSTTVTGTGTSFTTQLAVGDTITASIQTRKIVAITNNTTLSVSTPFSPNLSGAAFTYQKPIVRLANSAGATQVTVDSTGAFSQGVAVGNNSSPNPTTTMDVNNVFGPSAFCGFGCRGIFFQLTADDPQESGGNSTLTGIDAKLSTRSSASYVLEQAIGFRAQSTTAGAGSSIVDNYGFYVDDQTAGNNNYGIYIQGASTYALWVDSGISRFDGDLEFEGVTDNEFETTLTVADPTADNTITLPDASGTVCLDSNNCNFATTGDLDGYVQLQDAPSTQQTGDLNISGTGIFGTSVQTPSVTSTAALSVTGGTTLTLQSIGTNAATLDSGTTGAINIGTNANAKTITLGNSTGATQIVLNSGTGGINVGTNAVAKTVTIGSTTGTSALTLQAGTGAINIGTTSQARATNIATGTAAQTVTIGSTSSSSSLTLQSGTGAINIGTTAQARATNIATGAAAQTLTLGSTSSTSSTLIQGGSGGIRLTAPNVAIGDSPTAGYKLIVKASPGNGDPDDTRTLFVEKELNVSAAGVDAPEFGVNSTYFYGNIDSGGALNPGDGSFIGVDNSWFDYTLGGGGANINAEILGYRADLTLAGTGQVDGYTAFAANAPSIDGGVDLDRYYGLYVDAIGLTGDNFSYGVYQAGSGELNYFAGDVGIGSRANDTDITDTLDVNGTVRVRDLTTGGANNEVCATDSSGVLTLCSISLAEHKNNIEDLDVGLDTINQLQARQFNWNEDGSTDLGFIAEEVAAINPLLATYDGEGKLTGVKYRQMSALLVQGIQELDVKVSNNTAQITSVQSANAAQSSDIMNLTSQHDALSGQVASLQTAQDNMQNQLNSGQFSSLNVSGPSTLSDLTVTGTATINNLVVTNATVTESLTVNGHIITGNSSGDTTAEVGAASCDGTVTIDGNDTAGTITIQTGAAGCAPGVLATINFATAFDKAPRTILSPANAGSAAVGYYTGTTNNTSFTIDAANASANSTTYIYNYHVMQ